MEPATPHDDRFTADRYFQLVDEGVIGPDDRVELLDGVIVTVSPSGPHHASVLNRVVRALFAITTGSNVMLRVQTPLIASGLSAPEPDVAIVPARSDDYFDAHPTTALLVIEVSDSSVPQDRITKARIYAGAAIPEYWIVNVRDDQVEIMRSPDPTVRAYRDHRIAHRGETLTAVAVPGLEVTVDDLLPPPQPRD